MKLRCIVDPPHHASFPVARKHHSIPHLWKDCQVPFAKLWRSAYHDVSTNAPMLQDLTDHGPQSLLDQKCEETNSFCYGNCELVENARKVHPRYKQLLASCFHAVVDSMAYQGYKTRLDRFDLFHGHLVRLPSSSHFSQKSCLALLCHCYEYPAVGSSILPGIHLGHCHVGSTCNPTLDEWRFRNAVCTLGSQQHDVWLLDGAAAQVASLRVDDTPFGPSCPNTVWEAALGDVLADIYYIENDIYCKLVSQTTRSGWLSSS